MITIKKVVLAYVQMFLYFFVAIGFMVLAYAPANISQHWRESAFFLGAVFFFISMAQWGRASMLNYQRIRELR